MLCDDPIAPVQVPIESCSHVTLRPVARGGSVIAVPGHTQETPCATSQHASERPAACTDDASNWARRISGRPVRAFASRPLEGLAMVAEGISTV